MSASVSRAELLTAARSVTTTFDLVPDDPVPVADPGALTWTERHAVTDRYARHGFAVIQLPAECTGAPTLPRLTQSLGLGEPFLPPLYRLGGTTDPIATIAATQHGDTGHAHPSFTRTVGQDLHCDGTLQDIGYVKATVLLCASDAAEGGATTLFNSCAAFAELAAHDPDAAVALATPGVLIRQANINGSTEATSGPAFAAHGGGLLSRYSVAGTDRWATPDGVDEGDLLRGIEHLRRASRPDGPLYRQLTLRPGQALIFDNARLSHGRTPYRDSPTRRRCLYRSLHLAHPHLDRPGPPPPLDPELAEPLRQILHQMPMPLTPQRIADRRRRTVAGTLSDEQIRRGGAFEFEERTVPGPPNFPDVRLLICRPTAATGPHPVIFHTHGGGMVAGNNRSAELADELDRAQELHLGVVAVEYRLAPEHPDPAPIDDCYAALTWTSKNAADLGLDPNRIIVSGNSAGGALAAGLALRARDEGGPPLLGQMLQCPMLDDRCDTPSAVQLAQTGLWDGQSDLAGWNALLGSRRGTAKVSAYAAPARAVDLSGLPPAFIDVGSVEALRDGCVAFATRIWQAGGKAELHVWAGAFHSFDHWVPKAAVSQAAKRARVGWLHRLLAS